MPASRLQRSYTLGEKRELLAKFDVLGWSSRKFCAEFLVPRATWIRWQKLRPKLSTTRRNMKRKTLGGQGAKTIIPFKNELLSFMKDVRREEHILTSMHMVTYMKTYQKPWLDEYKAGKKDPYKAILGLCQAFARRHRFSQRVPTYSKLHETELVSLRDDFAAKFWDKYNLYPARDIINVDETAVHYDMPPGKIWAEIGKSSKVDKTQKHSDRVTAVLSCRANGNKHPILFIVHGTPGGTIDMNELGTYPAGHYYDVQQSGWMDSRVWKAYLKMLPPYIRGPTVIIADNFDAHVSQESADAIAGDLFSILEPLPPNTTSVCQPLDVGVMGPFKRILRMLWLEEAPVTTAAEKRLAIIKRSIKAWKMITPEAIRRSFEKALPKPEIHVL